MIGFSWILLCLWASKTALEAHSRLPIIQNAAAQVISGVSYLAHIKYDIVPDVYSFVDNTFLLYSFSLLYTL